MTKNLIKNMKPKGFRLFYVVMITFIITITLLINISSKNIACAQDPYALTDCPSTDKSTKTHEDHTQNATLVLTSSDMDRYQKIFELQKDGHWTKADSHINALENKVLLGYVQYQRYMHPNSYTSTYKELSQWLKSYADHPDAHKIYKLAIKKGQGKKPSHKPVKKYGIRGSLDISNTSSKEFIEQKKAIQNIVRMVRKNIQRGRITHALNQINKPETRKKLSQLEYDTLLGELSAGYMHFGETEKALDLAIESAKISGRDVPLSNWIAGLSAWKMGEYATAGFHFEETAQAGNTSQWMASAGAYWAARVHKKTGHRRQANKWLTHAAQYNRTFYGLIANTALRNKVSFQWSIPELTQEKINSLRKDSAGERALALIDLNRNSEAERELRRIHPNGNQLLSQALVAISQKISMPSLSMRVASAVKSPSGDLYDAALYPTAPWNSYKTHGIDQALVNAFIRQESRFNSQARNRYSGASGLMQLMPRTANYLSQKVRYSKSNSNLLLDPRTNISLGRQYIAHLLQQKRINNNLFLLMTAYNAGPGKLAKWQRKIDYHNDPLLFIESIPVGETRSFIERVMTNYWIYRIRMGQPTPSLKMVAQDQWPIYQALDDHDIRMASAD